MGLDEYRQLRRFSQTPEPAGDAEFVADQWRFVVQKHDASRLHYDLRLELDGVLKSWAIPKGPSLDPAEKRLAIHVEDHPLEYIDFEGVIPKNEYGGGTVMVWDRGHWTPRDNASHDFEAGTLKFDLDGHKLQGGWMLLRLAKQPAGKANQWLLIKEKDGATRSLREYNIQTDHPNSVLSGRDLEEIARDGDAIWMTKDATLGGKSSQTSRDSRPQASRRTRRSPQTDHPVPRSSAAKSTGSKRNYSLSASKFPKAKRGKLPKRVRPCLPTATRQAPSGESWVHEIKYDGYRMLCQLDRGVPLFYSRNGRDWTDRLPTLGKTIARLPCQQAMLDGEVAVVTHDARCVRIAGPANRGRPDQLRENNGW